MKISYQIPILKPSIKKKQVTAMHLVAGLMFILIAATSWVVINTIIQTSLMNTLNNLSYIYFISGLFIIATTIFANRKLNKAYINNILRLFEILLFAFIIVFSIIHDWTMIAIYGAVGIIATILTLISEIKANRPIFVTINESGVILPYKLNKQLKWEYIKNLLLKHGNFTINTRDNILIQHPLDKRTLIDSEAIDRYAKEQIEKNQHKYNQDW